MKTQPLLLLTALCLTFSPLLKAQEYVATPVTVSTEKVKFGGKIYLSHVVLEKQTLFGIAKAYGVSVEDIYTANPSLRETGLQKNAIILIPADGNAAAASQEKESPQVTTVIGEYKEHTVKWFEDLRSIARDYGVSEKQLIDYNGLKTTKVTRGQVIRIPYSAGNWEISEVVDPQQEETAAAAAAAEAALADSLAAAAADPRSPLEKLLDRILRRDEVTFSLLLPFQATGKVSESNMDFYSGVLMALRTLDGQGIRVKANIYDLSAVLPAADALRRNDFVLGPVAARDLETVLNHVDGGVPVVSPLDPKAAALAQQHQAFVHLPATAPSQYQELVRWVAEETRPQDRILLITEKNATNTSAAVGIRSALAQESLTYDLLTYAVSEGRTIPTTLGAKLSKNGVNHVVLASESEPFVSDALRNLGILLGKGYDLVLYAPSKVRSFDTIEGSLLHQCNLHLTSTYYVDYTAPDVASFVRAYRAFYRTEPSQFAFQGYDTVLLLVTACAQYGSHWQEALPLLPVQQGLHTSFRLQATENGTLQNTAVRRVVYNKDYTTRLVP